MNHARDTIAAVATAQGRGGVGIVRVSGPLAGQLAQAICRRELKPRFAHHGPFYGESELTLDEVVAFAAVDNLPSQKVMQAVGMLQDPSGSFEHPRLPAGHPLRPHVLYRIDRAHWEQTLRG